MCQIAVNFRFFMPFNFGWKAYFSARGRGVGLLFFCPRLGRGLLFFCPQPGRGAQRPTCLQKFLLFLKTGELAASNLHFRPISGKKACCVRGKQELKWGESDIDPVRTVLLTLIPGNSLLELVTACMLS